MQVKGQVKS